MAKLEKWKETNFSQIQICNSYLNEFSDPFYKYTCKSKIIQFMKKILQLNETNK